MVKQWIFPKGIIIESPPLVKKNRPRDLVSSTESGWLLRGSVFSAPPEAEIEAQQDSHGNDRETALTPPCSSPLACLIPWYEDFDGFLGGPL
jgi:hypothetical protein